MPHRFGCLESDQALKAHSAYVQAKAGDWESALTLISDVALAGIYAQQNTFRIVIVFLSHPLRVKPVGIMQWSVWHYAQNLTAMCNKVNAMF